MPLLDASVTGALADFATNIIGSLGLAGILVAMLLDCALIPIPSEVTMLFAGFGVSRGLYGLIPVILAGTLGNLVGSWISYWLGALGREAVARHDEAERRRGAVLHHHRALERADAFFVRWGAASVFFGRLLPLVRTYISLPAGIARMPFGPFSVLTLIGCAVWATALAIIGDAAGHNWTQWKHTIGYLDYVVPVLIVALLVGSVVRRRRSRAAV